MRMRVISAIILLACAGFAADSLNCRLVGNWPFGPCSNSAVDPARNLVFCGSGGGAYVLDMSNPNSPVMLSDAIRTRGYVRDVRYESNRLYVVSGPLDIYDVSVPSSPVRLSTVSVKGPGNGVSVAGNCVYVAGRDSGLRVFDATDPSNPSEVGRLNTHGRAWDVWVQAGWAYVANGDSGLVTVNVADPANPRETGRCVFGAMAKTVVTSGSYAYATCEAFGWEAGIDKRPSEAPMFFGLFTFFIIASTLIVLIPGIPLLPIMVLSQVLNGALLPIILIFVLLVTNDKAVMGTYTNSRAFNIIATLTTVGLIVMTILLLASPLIEKLG